MTKDDPTQETPENLEPSVHSSALPPGAMPPFEPEMPTEQSTTSQPEQSVPPVETSDTSTSQPQEVPAPDQQPPAPGTAIRDALVGRGYEAFKDYESDDQLIPHLESIAAGQQEIDRARPLIQYGQQYLENRDAFEDFLKAREQQREQSPEPPSSIQAEAQRNVSEHPAWTPPEYEERWESLCEYNQQLGQYTIRNEYQNMVTPTVAEKLTKYKQWELTTARDITRRFPELVRNEVEQALANFKSQLPQEIESHTEANRRAEDSEEFFNKHKEELYILDSNGAPRQDVTGNYLLTPRGQIMASLIQEANDKYGITDPLQLRRYAYDHLPPLESEQQQGGNGQTTPASDTPAPVMAPNSGPDSTPAPTKKERFLNDAINKARSTSNRSGSIAKAIEEERPQNRENLDFGEMLDQDLKEAGFQS